MLKMSLNGPLPDGLKDQEKMMRDLAYESFREGAAKLYASLLAAGHAEDARKIAKEAFKLDDSPGIRVAFVEYAMRAGQAREAHGGWLEQAGKDGATVEELQTRLRRTLDEADTSDVP